MTQQSQTNCPYCGQVYSLTPEQIGQTAPCHKCGKPFTAGGVVANYATPMPGGPGEAGNGMALASLICGLVFCLPPITTILAIVFGILGLKRAKEPGVNGRGQGLAIAGIVLGGMQVLMIPVIVACLIPSIGRNREMANRVHCASNMRQIGMAILTYTNDNGGNYPDSLDTLVRNSDLTPSVFVCPSGNDTVASSPAALNSGGHESYIYLGKGHTTSDDASVVELTEPISEHRDGSNCLFADGHVEFLNKAGLAQAAPEALKSGP